MAVGVDRVRAGIELAAEAGNEERLNGRGYETASWVQWFNTTRLHSSIGYLPPLEYEQRYRELAATAPTGEVA